MESENTNQELLTDRQLAQRLNVSRSFIHKLAASGRLPGAVKLGRARRWRADEVAAWVAAGCPSRADWSWSG